MQQPDQSHDRKELLMILILSGAFLLQFVSYTTVSQNSPLMMNEIKNETNGTLVASALLSQSLTYVGISCMNWVNPYLLKHLSTRLLMTLGSLSYTSFILALMFPSEWFLYLSGLLVGIGASVLWGGKFVFVSSLSSDRTLTRNMTIFFSIFSCNQFLAGLGYYLFFSKLQHLGPDLRLKLLTASLVLNLMAATMLIFLRPVQRRQSQINRKSSTLEPPQRQPAIVKVSRFFLSICKLQNLWIPFVSFHKGLTLAFQGSVVLILINNSRLQGYPSKGLVGLGIMFAGLGSVSSCSINLVTKYCNDSAAVVLQWFLYWIISFLVVINFPEEAINVESYRPGFIQPNAILSVFICFLLGFYCGTWNIIINSNIGRLFKKNKQNELSKEAAYSIYNFFQSIAAAFAFATSCYIPVWSQVLMHLITSLLGTIFMIPGVRLLQKKQASLKLVELVTPLNDKTGDCVLFEKKPCNDDAIQL